MDSPNVELKIAYLALLPATHWLEQGISCRHNHRQMLLGSVQPESFGRNPLLHSYLEDWKYRVCLRVSPCSDVKGGIKIER